MFNLYQKIEKSLGGLKFAVIIILIFSAFMIAGTFIESWYGTDYAGRLIYKTPLFMLVQFLMFLSIIFATLIRLPIKKRLHGFYVIHLGLIVIGVGSFVTYVAGIDGTIHLGPMTPTRQIIISDDVVEIIGKDDFKRATLKLPYKAFPTNINVSYGDITILDYLPFADRETQWLPESGEQKSQNTHSTSYTIANDNVSQDFTLSLHPEAYDFKASLSMGLLNITYLPNSMLECFSKENPSGLILWDSRIATCKTIEELKIKLNKTSTGKRFFAIKESGRVYSFVPDVSPWALDENVTPISDSPLRVFSKDIFKEKPNLFLFGKAASYYDKNIDKWVNDSFEGKNKIDLPWMGFELFLNKHSEHEVPTIVPIYTTPIQKQGALIKGELRAVKVKVRDQIYWATNERPVSVLIDGKKYDIYLTKKSFELPFELTLTTFKMDKDPGTNNPASYESFVGLFHEGNTTNHHIFMNNPLKYDGFTFYQASYSQDEQSGMYSSTLSVNVDQGRWLKYLGSILLVIGSIWHFVINKRFRKKENDLLGLN